MAEAPVRGGPTLLTASAAAIYTAGAASTWAILRHITVTNETEATAKFTIGVNTAATDTAGKRLAKSIDLPAGETWEWNGWVPLIGHASTPDLVYALASVASSATVTLGLVTGP